MDILLQLCGVLLIILGVAGSFLPIIPGAICSWLGLFVLHVTTYVPMNISFLGTTLAIAIVVFLLDLFLPIWGTKKLGGTRMGTIGSAIGLMLGLFFGPIGIILGPFVGALAGELTQNNDINNAVKAAFGSLVGFLAGTFIKFSLAVVYLIFFVNIFWKHKGMFF